MITENAYAKLNLALAVGGRADNGYHYVDSLMQTVSLYDTVSVEKGEGICLSCSDARLPTDGRNLAVKAANAFFAHTGILGGARIHIEKRIPEGAGLGGGSADGGAVLRALDKLYGTRLDSHTLCRIAAPLGADVPFCTLGGTARATGFGEALEVLEDRELCFVLLFGKVSLSTPRMYAALDSGVNCYPDTGELFEAWAADPVAALRRWGGNSFLPLSAAEDASVKSNISRLCALGGAYACISGKGPTVFALFESEQAAMRAARDSGGIFCKSTGRL